MKLMREVRCFPQASNWDAPGLNTWAGSPGRSGLHAFWIVRVVVVGTVSGETGYVCNIGELDRLLRTRIVARLREWSFESSQDVCSAAYALAGALETAQLNISNPPEILQLEWLLSPYLHLIARKENPKMMLVTLSFEFSASHRLRNSTWNEAENSRVFGKCANPNGHGHNYVLDVTVGGTSVDLKGGIFDLDSLQHTVKSQVIDRFDHKHLNLDCLEFATLNPTVENIAWVIWGILSPAIQNSRLIAVRVWETPKTYAEYDGRGY
ncbi:MAG: 6-carboxytetrahydropterin synthase [Planctomycetota bacterium]